MEEDNKVDQPATEQPVEDVENADQEKKKKKKKKNKKAAATEGEDYDAQLNKICEEQKVDEETKATEDGAEKEEGGEADPAKKKKKKSKYHFSINLSIYPLQTKRRPHLLQNLEFVNKTIPHSETLVIGLQALGNNLLITPFL